MTISNATPYLLGKLSYYSRVPKINNPYPTDSQEHEEWNQGYEDARKESEENKKK